ncbi:nitroreductase family protein [Paenibacillus sp. GSMTC-2017]|uniref:nitroreductase family protein n=1 Tax=Paenibacillus sp. GSMTC-2017 TaxID=2794350 RepID=UPI0018D8DA9D|nr:nitroreductase family protein [Paenibacillus sp. GSMTC-2017]MBH5318350.1 nitroreductase family protein [Paenibacillus sp. GSMTC-2017]
MTTKNQIDFEAIIRERHSVKHFDPTFQLQKEEIIELLDLANQAPSSWNLQHWAFLTIHDQAAKEKLLPIAYGQKQVVEASVVIAILGNLKANENGEAALGPAVTAGFMPQKVKDTYIEQIEHAYANYSGLPREAAVLNSSLAAMQLMLAAKGRGLDSCPIGGFNYGELVNVFNVPDHLIPIMLIPIGKAAIPAYASTRIPVEQSITWNGFE